MVFAVQVQSTSFKLSILRDCTDRMLVLVLDRDGKLLLLVLELHR